MWLEKERRSAFYRDIEAIDPEDYIMAVYYVESYTSLRSGAEQIAVGQSTGTWVPTKYETHKLNEKYGAKITRVSGTEKEGNVEIAFPIENIDPKIGGIPELMVTIAGSLFDIVDLKNVKLIDFQVPRAFAREFPGPKFGIEGVRKLIGSDALDRPLLGAVVKPCVGLPPETVAKLCYEVSVGGADFIKDDELLVSPKYCPLEERVTRVVEALDVAKEETGKTTLYAPCITTRVDKIVELAEKVVELGANALFFNVIATSFSAVQAVAEDPSVNVPLHVHRGMDGAFTKNPKHGIDFLVLCKLTRMAGGDSLRIGGIGGYIQVSELDLLNYARALREPFHDFKPVIPGIGGGIHPGNVKCGIDLLGNDIIFLVGGGISGHPLGPTAGAKALRLMIDAIKKEQPIAEVSEEHPEIKAAIQRWGIRGEGEK